MKFWTRRRGSNRTSNVKRAVFETNWAGSGGLPVLIYIVDDVYHYLQPENMQDVRDLLSHAHIVHANFEELRK
jgi:hypothetical protein